MIDVNRPYFHAMLFCIDHYLCRLIKTHGHTVQQGTGKDIRMVALNERRDINKQRKAHSMALGEAVAAKAFELSKDAPCKVFLVAFFYHAAYQLLFPITHLSFGFEGGHAAA